jgi:endoglucanase
MLNSAGTRSSRNQTSRRACGWVGGTILSLAVAIAPAQAAGSCFRGINLSGAEFGTVGGEHNTDYTYPSENTVRYFADKGFTSVRLPFLWERLQPKLNADFDEAEFERLQDTVTVIRANGMGIILDPHNYARYNGEVIGSKAVPTAAFADFWKRLGKLFAGQKDVSFGLMNEPHDMPAADWLKGANAAIAGIRAAGAKNLLLVPGTSWTGAHSWEGTDYGGSNADAMLGLIDPAGNFAFEVHQYLDDDFSGTKGNCSRSADAVTALKDFTQWLRAHKQRGYLGEFGAPGGADCVLGLKDMVGVVESNKDVWTGWSYWAAGDWWPESEPLNIQPTKRGDRPQLKALSPALIARSNSGLACTTLK